MNEFGKRLSICLKLRNKRPIDLANDLQMSKGNISMYMNSNNPPKTIKVVKKFADYLNVDVGYLMGLTNQMFVPTIKPLNSLTNDPETEMKRALINEANEILTQQNLENLQTMLNVLRTLKK